MASLPSNTISHFMHPAHRLTEVNYSTLYLCDGCKIHIPTTGKRFNCSFCDFDLHDYCATCPSRLISSNHPHPLSLVAGIAHSTITQPCKICSIPIEGLAYECQSCNFQAHPLCIISCYSDQTTSRALFPSGSSALGIGQFQPVGVHSGSSALGVGQYYQPAAVHSGSSVLGFGQQHLPAAVHSGFNALGVGQQQLPAVVISSSNGPGISQRIVQGVATRVIYDVIKHVVTPDRGLGDDNTTEGEETGFFDSIFSGIGSIFGGDFEEGP